MARISEEEIERIKREISLERLVLAKVKQSPEALEYLQKRGLHNSEMLGQFRLGFANRTLAYRLPMKNRQAGAELRGRLQNIGILRETGHEHFRGSLVIPVFDDEGRSLDELPPQTRRLLGLVDAMVTEECERLGVERADYRFSRRAVREKTGWGDTQLKVHLGRLVEMEYVVVHRGAGHSQRFGYELVYEKTAGDGPFLPGLINASELGQHHYDENRSGLEAKS